MANHEILQGSEEQKLGFGKETRDPGDPDFWEPVEESELPLEGLTPEEKQSLRDIDGARNGKLPFWTTTTGELDGTDVS